MNPLHKAGLRGKPWGPLSGGVAVAGCLLPDRMFAEECSAD
jgi:hypothetical protein